MSAFCFANVAAAQLDDEDFPPGLLGRYTAGGKTIERVDPDVSFVWGSDVPDERLTKGMFSAVWSGNILVRQNAKFRFHAYVQGHAMLSIDGKRVLDAARDEPGWISGEEVALGFGETPLKIEYAKTGKAARLQLFWSSDSFALEPLPSHLLFRDQNSEELAQIERGRIEFDAHRCNRCHVRKNEPPSPPAPSLVYVAAGLSDERLIEKLLDPTKSSPHARMPAFGFDREEATAVAAFIADRSQSIKLQSPGKTKEKDVEKERREGEVLLRSVGCLACHTRGTEGNATPWGGGDLTKVGERRSADWLNTWLNDPEKLNVDHRMPDMKLSSAERRQLVLFLSQSRLAAANGRAAGDKALIAAGRQLVESAHCAACHRIDGVKADVAGLADLSKPVDDWSMTCITALPDLKIGRPLYTAIDADAVKAYVESRAGGLSPVGEFERGQLVLERRNCLACHPRGGTNGIAEVAGRMARLDPDLQGKSEGLIPPALNAIGDKLLDDALAEAVSGERKNPRLPWLMARMPRFGHSQEEKRDLLAYLIGHDRIPDSAPASVAGAFHSESATDAQTLVVGHTLVGPKGFSCIACHQVGSYVPRNVALGTRGSDLMALGKQMRQEFFIRWTRSPVRIVPGMEMPSYVKAVPNVLDEDIDKQLAATWDALNDPKFTPPTNPTAVEQFWVLKPGEPARLVRDVFTVSQENGGGYAARAFAVGLNNGHNMLFDLDTFTLRAWTFGDFARQRTQGKSWYWDMAGVPVMSGFGRESDFALLKSDQANFDGDDLIRPRRRFGVCGTLKKYDKHNDGVWLSYDVNFEIDGKTRVVSITENIAPVSENRAGWRRIISATQIPAGYELVVTGLKQAEKTGDAEISVDPAADMPEPTIKRFNRGVAGDENGAPQAAAVLPQRNRGRAMLALSYTCQLQAAPGELKLEPANPPQIEQVTSTPGFEGIRLPISRAIMPTALTFTADGKLAFTSLKGDVFIADDSDGDGVQDRLTLFEEGLAAPFGIIADGDDLIVAHKPEVLRLRDTDGDGRADQRAVVATGWGYNDNYHDWTCGILRDRQGNLYVGIGSDYAQKDRPEEQSRWRGKVLRISPEGEVTPVGHSFRYPIGLAMNSAGDIFVSDNQGVQNTFNEINRLVAGRHYGVPSRHERNPNVKAYPPAVQVPHPWSRSVNGLFFLPENVARDSARGNPDSRRGASGYLPDSARDDVDSCRGASGYPFAGHGIGCEYDSRFLVRFTTQQVGDVMQGAVYYFSRPPIFNSLKGGVGDSNFVGPICGTVAPNGDIYVGSIYDSGWLGGQNTGAITRLRANGKFGNGIRELRATSDGFEIEFLDEVDRTAAAKTSSYSISGYTRVWEGSYATPDSGRHRADVLAADVSEDGRTVRLKVEGLREGHVYDVSCGKIGADSDEPLFPATGHYTLHKIPR